MLAIEVELLTGRYVAAKFNDRNSHEWPIHPARLFAAMVAAWGQVDEPSSSEADALRSLELLGAPNIDADTEPTFRTVVGHFVPDNDVSAASRDLSDGYRKIVAIEAEVRSASSPGERDRFKKQLDKQLTKSTNDSTSASASSSGPVSQSITASVLTILPDERGKQARYYPAVVPRSTRSVFVWPSADLSSDVIERLDEIASRVHRIGHSSSLVSCRAMAVEPGDVDCSYVVGQGRNASSLRVPGKGMFDRLVADFVVNPGIEPRTTPAMSAAYVLARPQRPETPISNLAGELIILPFSRLDQRSAKTGVPGLAKSLELSRALRGALMAHSEQPSPTILSGHIIGPKPSLPSLEVHAAFVPLPFVGGSFGDGRLFGMAVLLPTDTSPEDNHRVRDAIKVWAESAEGNQPRLVTGTISQEIDLSLSPEQASLRPGTWMRASHKWVSVLPIALDRFPAKRLSESNEAMDEAAAIIVESCLKVGLPQPTLVETSLQPLLRGSKPVRAFPGPIIGGRSRACVHAAITWSEPVAGPLVLGAARYLGYGLMFPVDPRGTVDESSEIEGGIQ
jgi:CRISPR-associated protein Csb2